jgi:uncharacterized protein YjbI with pentapeptide repeats
MFAADKRRHTAIPKTVAMIRFWAMISLSHVTFANADLSMAKLTEAELSGSTFFQARLAGATLDRANLQSAKLPTNMDFREVSMMGTFFGAT